MAELVLSGCPPVPIAGYLKALGILRLIAEQKSGWAVRGAWRAAGFTLASPHLAEDARTAREQLEAFLLHDYRPTPILAPWNGGSGFYPKDNAVALERIHTGGAERLADYRVGIDCCRERIHRLGLTESPKNEQKNDFLTGLRGQAPESLLDWLDAAVLLTGDETRYPPLLGTGGNDGRLDFTNNFMQRLCDLMDAATGAPSARAGGWLTAALFGTAAPDMSRVAVGQFDPGGVGGPNASTGFDGGSLVNPWDFVLMLEGAILFAAAATRRLESSAAGALAYPFTVRPTGANHGGLSSTDEGQARAEIWLPLWERCATATELRRLLSEGRATLNAKTARDGLGFSRAIAALGVDRGITAFQRYGFLMRSGKAYLATPLSRIEVRANPQAELIQDLESGEFLDRLRRFARAEQAPAGIRSQVRRLEDALFTLTRQGDQYTLQKLLRITGRIGFALSKSASGRDAVPRLPRLQESWVHGANDGSSEFRCAAALAAITPSLLPFILPTSPVKSRGRQRGPKWQWDPDSRRAVWREGSLRKNLGDLITRRHIEGSAVTGDTPGTGVGTADLRGFFDGGLDEKRLSELLLGLILADPAAKLSGTQEAPLPAGYLVLKPLFTPHAQLVEIGLLAPEQDLPLPGALIAHLRAGHTQKAVDLGWRRLRASGLSIPDSPRRAPSAFGSDGPRLLAALAVPLAAAALSPCLSGLGAEPGTDHFSRK